MKNREIKVFVIEDNALYGKIVKNELKVRTDYEVTLFDHAEAMLAAIRSGNKPHVIVSDFYLDHQIKTAHDLVIEMKRVDPTIPIVVMTAQSDLQSAIKVLKEGAFDFIVKDGFAMDRLVYTLYHVCELVKLKEEIHLQKSRSSKDFRRLSMVIGTVLLVVLAYMFF